MGLGNWNVQDRDEEQRNLRDFLVWREEHTAVQDVSVFRRVSRNLVTEGGSVHEITVAEMSPGGFRVARVPPLLGRTLVEEDARGGATPALVIGYDPWRARFASDPDVVGTQVTLAGTRYEIVGFMPEGFRFPMNDEFWTPLTVDPAAYERVRGPEVFVFGRLAPGYDLDEAQSQMTVIGDRMATSHPDTHGDLRAQALPYAHPLVSVNPRARRPWPRPCSAP